MELKGCVVHVVCSQNALKYGLIKVLGMRRSEIYNNFFKDFLRICSIFKIAWRIQNLYQFSATKKVILKKFCEYASMPLE